MRRPPTHTDHGLSLAPVFAGDPGVYFTQIEEETTADPLGRQATLAEVSDTTNGTAEVLGYSLYLSVLRPLDALLKDLGSAMSEGFKELFWYAKRECPARHVLSNSTAVLGEVCSFGSPCNRSIL